jgi:hypothetical protein
MPPTTIEGWPLPSMLPTAGVENASWVAGWKNAPYCAWYWWTSWRPTPPADGPAGGAGRAGAGIGGPSVGAGGDGDHDRDQRAPPGGAGRRNH